MKTAPMMMLMVVSDTKTNWRMGVLSDKGGWVPGGISTVSLLREGACDIVTGLGETVAGRCMQQGVNRRVSFRAKLVCSELDSYRIQVSSGWHEGKGSREGFVGAGA